MILPALLAVLLAAPSPPSPPVPPVPPAPVRPAPGIEGRRLGEWPAKPSGKRVTLADDGLSLDDALQRIADAAGWNLVANTGALGDRDLRLALKNVPVEEALDAVLEATPLVATRRGDIVTVAPGRAPSAARPVLAGLERPTGKRFTGDFADAPVGKALTQIADAADLSLVLPPGLRGAVSGHFREAPVEDVLRAVLAQAGLTARREGSVLTVSRGTGPSVVIQGGKRGFRFDLQGLPDQVQGEVDRALDEAQTEIDGDAARADRDAERARTRERGADRRAGKGSAHVTRGDRSIGPGEHAGEVVALTGDVRIGEGATADRVVAVLGSVALAPGASVAGEVVSVGGDIHVGPGARVAGEAVSVGGKIVIDPGGTVEGEQVSIDVPGLGSALGLLGARAPDSGEESPLVRLATALVQFILFFLFGLALLHVFPRRMEALTAAVVHEPVKAVLTGILGSLALPLVMLLLAVTVVGVPLAAVVLLAAALAGIMGFTALALHLGRLVPLRRERGREVAQLALGTALLVLVGRLPVLGPLTWVAAWLFVLGIVIRTRFGRPPTAPPPVYGTTAPPPAGPPPMPPPVTGTGAR